MTRLHSRILRGVGVIIALASALGLVGAALAFFSTTGTASGQASTGSLSAPAITSASAGAGTVTLSWSAITPPAGSGGVTYYVTRDGGVPSSGCPSSASPASVTSCTDTGLSKGTYNYTVTAVWRSWSATSSPATPVSVAFGALAKLVFTTQPDGSPTGGVAFPQQPVVTAEDAGGNAITSYTGTVSLTIKTGTSGAALTGCSGSLSGGVTTFSGCKIDKTGSYVLTAGDTANNLSVDSNSFTVSAGPATQLVFTTQPDGSPTGGVAFPQQPVVTAQDAGGNPAAGYTGTVTLSLKSGTSGASLTGCTGALSSSATTFSGCEIDKTGTYVLTAGDGTRTVDSNSFTVSAGPASQLVFTTQPDGSATAGSAFPQQPVVTVEDAGGNPVTTDSSTVTLGITSGTPTSGGPGTLSGCTATETSGVVSFSGCKIDTAGTGYKLHATDGGLTPVDSAAFNVSAPSVGVSVIGQGAAKSATISNVKSASGATDLIVLYCYGGSTCTSTNGTATVNTGAGTPFASASTNTIEAIVSSGNTKSCVEVIQAVGNGTTGTVTVNLGSGYSVGFVNVLQLSSGSSVKAVQTNPSTQTSSATATATLPTPVANSEIALVGLDGNSGADTITPPAGMTAITPLSGFSNPESNSTIGNAGGNLAMYFDTAAQASANFSLTFNGNPFAVDWGTVALQVG